jgi:mevalonate kinase/isopentenyl-diphosphate delta-isomerase type 1
MASAPGKVVLFGEHAVLYGSRAIAVPLPKKIYARVLEDSLGVHLIVPRWGIDTVWVPNSQHQHSTLRAIERILTKIGVTRPKIRIELFPEIPRAMGLGSSAAAAVALIRAISNYYSLALSDEEVNQIAYESENIVHGNSSGIDNTVATFNQPLLYQMNLPSLRAPIQVLSPIPLVVGLSNNASLTAPMVARVQAAWQKNRQYYDSIFNAIDQRVGRAMAALQQNDLQQLGDIMNENHKLLKQLNVSDPTLDRMVATAREHGAAGAKLTGGGGGGAVIALCPENSEAVAGALNDSGFETFHMTVGSTENESGSDRSTTSVATMEQKLVTVDDNDTITGHCTREKCHAGEGILHRAFSIFIFDRKGRVLLQKRSKQKTLWPLYWSNSVCSHPRAGESTHAAAQRRLTEELGISTPLSFLFKFSYQARYGDAGSENELCSVFIGRTDETIQADPQEIEQWRFVSIQALEEELASSPERFTPWFKIEWQRLRRHPMVKAYQKETAPV